MSGGSHSRSKQIPKFEIRKSKINHFTGEDLSKPQRDYTPKRSNTLLKGTFATSQKKRGKDQMFIDEYTKALNNLME